MDHFMEQKIDLLARYLRVMRIIDPKNRVKSGFYLANDVAPHAGMSIPLLRPVAKTPYPLRKQQPLTCWIRRVWTFFVMWWYVLQYIYIYITTGCWFQTWLLFSIIYINIWDNPSHWLIFFRGVEPPTYAMMCRYMCSYMSYPVVTSSLSDTRCIFFSSSGPIFRCRHVFPGGLSMMFFSSCSTFEHLFAGFP